jgi:hypothetical protein
MDAIIDMLKEQAERGSSISIHSDISLSDAPPPLDPRLEHLFFQLMLSLFEREPGLYPRQLRSLQCFLEQRKK